MNYIVRFLACLVFVFFFPPILKAEVPEDTISIIDVLHKLQKLQPNLSIGIETIYGVNELRDKIPITEDTLRLISKGNVSDVARMIKDNTDYNCRDGKNYLIVAPKNSTKYSPSISNLKFIVTNASNLAIDDFLNQIHGADGQNQQLLIRSGAFSGSQIRNGMISVQSGTYTGYDLLNEMARQLNARVWVLTDIPDQDKNGTSITPEHTWLARVSFYLKQ